MIGFNLPEHSRVLGEACGHPFDPYNDQSIARLGNEDGRLIGGVIFSDYCIASVQVHCAGFSPNWLSKNLLALTFDYAFVQLKCNKLVALVKSSNQKALALDLNLGFTHETTVSNVYPDADLFILTMQRSRCRYLGGNWPRIAIEAARGALAVKLPGRE